MKLFSLNQTSKCPLFNDRRTQTHSPSPLRIVFIGASWCQVLVSGWYFSAVFQRVCPSYPPTTYRTPPHAATPAPRRATDIGQTKDQRLDSGSHLQNKKQWWGTCSQWNENLLPASYNAEGVMLRGTWLCAATYSIYTSQSKVDWVKLPTMFANYWQARGCNTTLCPWSN